MYDHQLGNIAYFQRYHSGKYFSRVFAHKMAVKASWHRNYVTVTLWFGLSRV